MSQTVLFNGVSYSVPDTGDEAWGNSLTSYFVSISTGTLQKTGGNFTLTADVNFGVTFGLLSRYFTARTVNPATAGVFRLAKTDTLDWRNNANSANLALGINSSNQLIFDGSVIQASIAIGTFDGNSKSTNGASISGTAIFFQSADDTYPGMVTTLAQSFLGPKSFDTSITSPIFISATTNPADAGTVRLANGDFIEWRTANNGANRTLRLDSSNILSSTAPFTSAGIIMGTQITSTVAIGVAPFVCISTTFVDNLYVNKSASLTSQTANAAAAGLLRLAKTDAMNWRNNANSADVALSIDGSDRLLFAGSLISTFTTQSANTVFSGPTSGAVALPAFRALVGADIPTATQGNQETGTSTTVFVSPGVQQFHPSAAKAWGDADLSGNLNSGFNVASVTDTGVGLISFNYTVAFSSTSYCAVVSVGGGSTVVRVGMVSSLGTNASGLSCVDAAGTLRDPAGTNQWYLAAFGDQ